MSVDAATGCPSCRTRGAVQPLVEGASLDGSSCRRCGGTLLPTTGSERLLTEELGLDRGALVDLAESFGGRRYECPSCHARMRSLILRGVDVDLCFHCGALWLDAGELEQLSGNRHRGLEKEKQEQAPSSSPSSTTTLQRPEASVRLDARHPVARQTGKIVRGLGLGVGGAIALALLPPAFAPVAVALFAGGTWLRRRKIVDVFPRARRLLRSSRWMPTDARDPDAERLDDKTSIVVRPWGLLLAASSFVDSVGRQIAPIEIGAPRGVVKRAKALARKLGAALVVDHRFDDWTQRPAWRLAPIGGDVPFHMRLLSGPSAYWTFEAATVRHAKLFTLQNAVPARGNENRAERLALCFCLETPAGARLRFHDAGDGYIVVVDAQGEPLGCVQRKSAGGVDWLSFALAGRALRLHLVVPPVSFDLPILDDAGHRHGSASFHEGRLHVDAAAAAEDAAFCCVVLAAVAALDAGRLLQS